MTEAEAVDNLMRYRSRMWAMAFGVLRDHHLVEDALQEVSLLVLQKREDYDADRASFVSWVLGMTRIVSLKTLQKRRPQRLMIDSEVLQQIQESLSEGTENAQEEDRHLALVRCLDKLSPEQARAVRRKYLGRASATEIAEELGRTVTATYSMLQRLRATLLTCMRREMEPARGC